MTPEQRARQVGETMFANDVATRDTMGMALLACEPGRAVMRMVVTPRHLNGHRICHGGFVFTLADVPEGVMPVKAPAAKINSTTPRTFLAWATTRVLWIAMSG